MSLKKITIIKTITIFLCIFLFSYIYQFFPNFLTAIFFPVNESLFEHLKLIYSTEIIVGFLFYLYLKYKNEKFPNYFLALFISTIFNILLFFIIYLAFYRGEHQLLPTMILYFLTLCLSQYLFYLLINTKKENKQFNFLSFLLIFFLWLFLAYFTFNPPRNNFFLDPLTKIYGIKKN